MNKICNFYINDTHLTVTLFEYMKKEIIGGTKIITIMQDNVHRGLKELSTKFKGNRIKENVEFLEKLDIEDLYKEQNITVIIKGSNEFIFDMENVFSKLLKNENIKANIISCYNISFHNNITEITKEYDQLLSTEGIVNLKNIEAKNIK